VTILDQLGAHAAGGYREGLPGPLRAAVRLHLADTVGAWIAAGATAEGRALARFGPPDRQTSQGRVALGCALARLSEIDDIHLASCTTPGAIVVPAAITLGSALGSDGAAVAQAIAVGYDLMTRVGAALGGPAILYRGIWPTYLLAPLAVAGVAARLLGLDEERSTHALAIASELASPGVGRQSGAGMSRWLAVGNAARSGVTAALSAQAGFTGDLRLFEGEFLSGVYQLSLDVDALGGSNGPPSVTLTGFKPWCGARQTTAAVQALREILEDGVTPPEMSSLAVGVPLPYLKMIDHGVVLGERTSFLTSVSYQMAQFAFDPDASLDPAQVRDSLPRVMEAFMTRISVRPDDDLLRHYPRAWPALVSVETRKGRREKLVLHVPGDPERAFDELQVAAKFWRLVGPLLGERSTEELLRLAFGALDGDGGPKALCGATENAIASLRT